MKKLLLTASLVAFSAPAYASTLPVYLSLGAGLTSTNDSNWDAPGLSGSFSIDNAANFSAAVGTSFYKNTRTELEVSYRKADLGDVSIDGAGSGPVNGSLKTWAFLVNGYYDFPVKGKFIPYISAGLGVADHKGTISGSGITEDASDTVFAYQAGLGANYVLNDKASLWAGYRYLGSSDANFDSLKASYNANEFRAGVKFNF